MTEFTRNSLEWARDVAKAYRMALRQADPEQCAVLDERARAVGQRWIAPEYIPPDVAAEAVQSALTPADIARVCGIPVGTIYSWVSRGMLQPAGPGTYWVRDAISLNSHRRVRRLDSA